MICSFHDEIVGYKGFIKLGVNLERKWEIVRRDDITETEIKLGKKMRYWIKKEKLKCEIKNVQSEKLYKKN